MCSKTMLERDDITQQHNQVCPAQPMFQHKPMDGTGAPAARAFYRTITQRATAKTVHSQCVSSTNRDQLHCFWQYLSMTTNTVWMHRVKTQGSTWGAMRALLVASVPSMPSPQLPGLIFGVLLPSSDDLSCAWTACINKHIGVSCQAAKLPDIEKYGLTLLARNPATGDLSQALAAD